MNRPSRLTYVKSDVLSESAIRIQNAALLLTDVGCRCCRDRYTCTLRTIFGLVVELADTPA